MLLSEIGKKKKKDRKVGLSPTPPAHKPYLSFFRFASCFTLYHILPLFIITKEILLFVKKQPKMRMWIVFVGQSSLSNFNIKQTSWLLKLKLYVWHFGV